MIRDGKTHTQPIEHRAHTNTSELWAAAPSTAVLHLWQALAQLSKILLLSIYKADPDSHSREYSFTGSVAGLVAGIVSLCKKKKTAILKLITIVYTSTKQELVCS